DRRACRFAWGVGDRDEADRVPVAHDVHDRSPLTRQLVRLIREPVQARVLALDEALVAERESMRFDARDRALPRHRLHHLPPPPRAPRRTPPRAASRPRAAAPPERSRRRADARSRAPPPPKAAAARLRRRRPASRSRPPPARLS